MALLNEECLVPRGSDMNNPNPNLLIYTSTQMNTYKILNLTLPPFKTK
jgi:hypothetical protein